MLQAFHGDTKVREHALKNLAVTHEDERIARGLMNWSDGKGSVAASLIQSGDTGQFVEVLGLPAWLAFALDTLVNKLSLMPALAETRATLEAIHPGSDASNAGSKLTFTLLNELEATSPLPAEARKVLRAVADLHARAARGEVIAPSEWRQARRDAVQVTNEFAPDPGEGVRVTLEEDRLRMVSLTVEAAAWDPLKSPSAVGETLRHWLSVAMLAAESEFGWTAEDDTRVGNLLAEMHKTYIEANPEEKRDVFELLEAHYPDVEARLRSYTIFKNEFGSRCTLRSLESLRLSLGFSI